MKSADLDQDIEFQIGRAEAIILFDLLADFLDQQSLNIRTEADRIALIRLYGHLEGCLAQTDGPESSQAVEASRTYLVTQSAVLPADQAQLEMPSA